MREESLTYTLGELARILAVLLLFPLLVGAIYQEGREILLPYAGTAAGLYLISLFLTRKKPENLKLSERDGLVIVALSWLLLSIFGALPFVLTREIPNPADALFEMASGFTTTGSTILTDVEALSHASLFWRSFAHWVGGMGILVFALAVLPGLGSDSIHLMKAEVPGPVFGKLRSRIRSSARTLYFIYFGMTVLLTVLLMAAGMNLFDALIHAFGTAGTGGFSSKAASIGYWKSPAIEWITGIGMLVFGVNFNLYYYFLLNRSWPKSEELRWYLSIVGIATGLIFLDILPSYTQAGTAFRDSFFTVSSIITTTGYATANFDLWPLFSKEILLLLMFFGACAGSTAGGLKISRVALLSKSAVNGLRQARDPRRALRVRYEGKPVEETELVKLFRYFQIYLLFFLGTVFLITPDCESFMEAFSSAASCFNNIGPGFGMTGPCGSFAPFSNFSKVILTLAMIAGRLEIYPILVLFSRRPKRGGLRKRP